MHDDGTRGRIGHVIDQGMRRDMAQAIQRSLFIQLIYEIFYGFESPRVDNHLLSGRDPWAGYWNAWRLQSSESTGEVEDWLNA